MLLPIPSENSNTISPVDELNEHLRKSFLKYFSVKAAPQVWGIINRVRDEKGVKRTRKKLESVTHSTDKFESSAATQALKLIRIFEDVTGQNFTLDQEV